MPALHLELQFKTIYQDDFLVAEVDAACSLMCVKWYRHPSSIEFRRLFKLLLDMAIEHELSYWLSDSLSIHYLEFSDQKWLLEEMAPIMKDSCVKKYARITTKERMALMDMSRIMKGIDQDAELAKSISLEEFFCREEALDWLLSD